MNVLRIFVLFFIATEVVSGNPCPATLLPLNPARERAEQTMAAAKWVSIDDARVEAVAGTLADLKFPMAPPTWNFPPYPDNEASFDKMFRFFLLVDSINYQYFHRSEDRQFSDHDGVGAGLVVRRIAEHWDLFGDATLLKSVTGKLLSESLFQAAVPLPAVRDRARGLREVGQFLHAHQGTSWADWLGRFSTPVELAVFLSTQLKAFHDPFLKRAQLFVGMLVGRYRTDGQLPPALRNPEGMTVYADYILPMILHRMGILNYRSDLERKIRVRRLLASGSREEEEIRAATIVAADKLLAALRKHSFYQDVNILGVDSALWLQCREVPVPDFLIMPSSVYVRDELPHHRTLTTHY